MRGQKPGLANEGDKVAHRVYAENTGIMGEARDGQSQPESPARGEPKLTALTYPVEEPGHQGGAGKEQELGMSFGGT